MDPFAEFLKDRCVVQPGAKAAGDEVYDAYTKWCPENGSPTGEQPSAGVCTEGQGISGVQDGGEGRQGMG